MTPEQRSQKYGENYSDDKLAKADIADSLGRIAEKFDTTKELKVMLVQGEQGERGEKGEPGEKGEKGDKGEQGEAGLQGPPGPIGPKGEKGDQGDPGEPGRDGIDGEDGLNGADGSPDTPAQIKEKLESLKGNNRLDAKAIKGLDNLDDRFYMVEQSMSDKVRGYGGGSNVRVQDEGMLVMEEPVKIINFTGSGVQVSKDGEGRVTVTITGTAASESNNETPSGEQDDSNTEFTLAHTPNPAANLKLYMNGQLQVQDVDYTLSGGTITFTTAPLSTDVIRAFYQY